MEVDIRCSPLDFKNKLQINQQQLLNPVFMLMHEL